MRERERSIIKAQGHLPTPSTSFHRATFLSGMFHSRNFPSSDPLRKYLSSYQQEHTGNTKEAMPAKLGVHAFDINPYLHEFFEPILID